ncbi:MAG: DapH/DapD/GlmU-related protein [Spongiibacteraceae bacterium]
MSSRGLWLSLFYRIIYFSSNHKNLRNPSWWLIRFLEIPATYLNTVLCKSDMLGDCTIEEGVYLADGGYLIFGAQSVGSGSIVHSHVTIGEGVANRNAERPRIGKNVWIGPNCIIAGGIEVGDGCTILPNTYITHSLPANTVVRGNPARVVRRNFDSSDIRNSLAIVEDIAKE